MKAIYRADDGREFESKDKCRKYEQSFQSRYVRMFNDKGEETHNYNTAYFIVNTACLDKFEFERMKNNLEHEYCEEGGAAGYRNAEGIYVWINNQYTWLTFRDGRALRKILDAIGR